MVVKNIVERYTLISEYDWIFVDLFICNHINYNIYSHLYGLSYCITYK